jgi:hypothetical protein
MIKVNLYSAHNLQNFFITILYIYIYLLFNCKIQIFRTIFYILYIRNNKIEKERDK